MFGFFRKKERPSTAEAWFESAKQRHWSIHNAPFSDARMPQYVQTLLTVIGELEEAIKLKPDYGDAWFYKACVHWVMADHDKALSCCEDVVRLDPTHATALLCIGNSKWERGDIKGALSFYHRAVTSDPNDAAAWYQLSAALDASGEAGEADKAMERALELSTDETEIMEESPWLRPWKD